MKQEIIADLLGNLTLVNYIVAFIFVMLTLMLRWIWKTVDSVKNNKHTPHKFSLGYWIKDNVIYKFLSFISNMISVFILLRFSNELIGQNFSYFLVIVVGFGLDYFIDRLKSMQKKKLKRTR